MKIRITKSSRSTILCQFRVKVQLSKTSVSITREWWKQMVSETSDVELWGNAVSRPRIFCHFWFPWDLQALKVNEISFLFLSLCTYEWCSTDSSCSVICMFSFRVTLADKDVGTRGESPAAESGSWQSCAYDNITGSRKTGSHAKWVCVSLMVFKWLDQFSWNLLWASCCWFLLRCGIC
jgi:hypothetical protein